MASFRKAGILFFVLMVPALSYIIYRFGTTNYYTLPRFIPVIDSTTNEPVMHKVTDQFGARTDTLFRKVPGFSLIDQDGKPAGKVSSGAYGYHIGQSLALAYLRSDIGCGTELEVMILGRPHRATVLNGPAFDPEGCRLRA